MGIKAFGRALWRTFEAFPPRTHLKREHAHPIMRTVLTLLPSLVGVVLAGNIGAGGGGHSGGEFTSGAIGGYRPAGYGSTAGGYGGRGISGHHAGGYGGGLGGTNTAAGGSAKAPHGDGYSSSGYGVGSHHAGYSAGGGTAPIGRHSGASNYGSAGGSIRDYNGDGTLSNYGGAQGGFPENVKVIKHSGNHYGGTSFSGAAGPTGSQYGGASPSGVGGPSGGFRGVRLTGGNDGGITGAGLIGPGYNGGHTGNTVTIPAKVIVLKIPISDSEAGGFSRFAGSYPGGEYGQSRDAPSPTGYASVSTSPDGRYNQGYGLSSGGHHSGSGFGGGTEKPRYGAFSGGPRRTYSGKGVPYEGHHGGFTGKNVYGRPGGIAGSYGGGPTENHGGSYAGATSFSGSDVHGLGKGAFGSMQHGYGGSGYGVSKYGGNYGVAKGGYW